MEQYDPTKVNIIVDGYTLVGFTDGDKITGERSEEKRSMMSGTDGHITFVKNANDSGEVTVSLKHNSPANEKLKQLYKSDQEFTFACIDSNFSGGDVGIAGTRCVVQNTPSFDRTDSVEGNEWTLLVADYEDSFVGVL